MKIVVISAVSLLILCAQCGGSKFEQVSSAQHESGLESAYAYETSLYPFVLTPLPYAYDALEPYIDALTMHIHHAKHYKSYIDNLNATLAAYPALQTLSLKDLVSNLTVIPEEALPAVINFGGGVYNHAFFWTLLTPNFRLKPEGDLEAAIIAQFGSFDQFVGVFTDQAKKLFGSGWTWLCVEQNKRLKIVSLPNQDNPLAGGLTPILCLDLWEHAYYLHYKNVRADYIDAWWHIINWPRVSELYEAVAKRA